jgi:acarbose 7IV-phosphotransferase
LRLEAVCGDALFSAFVHGYVENKDPYHAMQKAVLFAGYKIGETGAAEGFMSAQQLETGD